MKRNTLRGMAVQKEVDHLNWVAKLSAFWVNNSITPLDIQTDDHKCGFGKWLYGDARKEAEKIIPGLAELFKEIEEPHANLHSSAIDIDTVFVQADTELPKLFTSRKVDHLRWASSLRDTFLENKEAVTAQTDPTKCALGKWINSDDGRKTYQNGDGEFKEAWNSMIVNHQDLHNSATKVKESYQQIHENLKLMLLERLLDHKNWSEKVGQAIIAGKSDLGVQTDPTKCGYGKYLLSSQA